MKIAIAYADGAVASDLGVCQQFLIVTAENGQPTAKELSLILMAYYAGQPLVTVAPYSEEPAYLAANALAGTDKLELTVSGHEGQSIVTARFDNLGKGASGAAVQNMNLMLGLEETTGLL